MIALKKNSKIIILGTNSDAIVAYFKFRNNFNIIGFMDNDAKEEGLFCGKTLFTLKKIKDLDGAIVIIYSEKSIQICKWLNDHNYKIFKDFIPSFMFEYKSIEISKVLEVTPRNEIENVLKLMRKDKKIILIHGNCQVIPLKLYLNNNERFTENYILYDIPPLHLINDKNKVLFEMDILFKDISVFVTQNISKNNRFGYTLSTQNFLDHLSPKCTVIRISNLWFAGYFPQHFDKLDSEINRYRPGSFLWQDNNLDKFGKKRVALNSVIKILKDVNYYNKEFLDELFEKNLENMRKRDENVDIKLVDYLRANCKKEILFYSSNHPKNIVIKELAKRLLVSLNLYIDQEFVTFNYESLIDKTETLKITCEAIYPSVFKYLGLLDKMDDYSFNYPGSIKTRQFILFEDYIKDYLVLNFEGYLYDDLGNCETSLQS